MRKVAIITAVILTALLMSAVTLASESEADDAEYFEVDGYKYKVVAGEDSAVELVNSEYPNDKQKSGYSDSKYSGDVTVPAKITYSGKEYSVIGLGVCAFFHSSLSSVTLNEGLRYISMSAFADSTLTSITIPASVVTLGHDTPYGPSPSVTIGAVFSSNLTSLTFADGSKLSHIGKGALSGTNLTELTIPAGVTDLGVVYQVLANGINNEVCALEGIPENTTIEFADGSSFSWDSKGKILYRSDELYYVFDKTITSITLRQGTNSIGDCALMDCESLTSVDLSSLKTIGDCAFANTGIEAVELPSSVQSVGEYAFANCSSLTSVKIPSSVKSIENGTFYQCTKIETIILSEGLETIGESAFCYVAKMKKAGSSSANVLGSIVIPSTVKSIGKYFLKGALRTDGSSDVVFLGKTAPTIGDESFITSYDKSTGYSYDFNLWCDADSVGSYRNGLGGIGKLNGFDIGVSLTGISVSEGGTKTVDVTWTGPAGSSLSAVDGKDLVDVVADGKQLMLTAKATGSSNLVISLVYNGTVLTSTEIGIEVKEASDPDQNVSTETKTETVKDQSVTTTTTTVTDSTGQTVSVSTEIVTASSDGKIESTATVEENNATVTVNADSNTSLKDIIDQAGLIEDVVTGGESSSVSISTEIVIENKTEGVSVTLTLDVIESLNSNATEMNTSVKIVVGDFVDESMTSAQVAALGNGTAFELSALVVDDNEQIVDRLHDLGRYVEAFLPYDGDPSGMGVFYIDENGRKTDMNSIYDADRGGLVFMTNHFSLFAVMETPEIVPDNPYYPDDDDYPFIPPVVVVTEDNSDETTKVVACVAAAVAVAIMAMFLFIDGRKR